MGLCIWDEFGDGGLLNITPLFTYYLVRRRLVRYFQALKPFSRNARRFRDPMPISRVRMSLSGSNAIFATRTSLSGSNVIIVFSLESISAGAPSFPIFDQTIPLLLSKLARNFLENTYFDHFDSIIIYCVFIWDSSKVTLDSRALLFSRACLKSVYQRVGKTTT